MKWLNAPEDHDYPAARDYLSLHMDPRNVEGLLAQLRLAKNSTRAAKDILRASGLDVLPHTNRHVQKNLGKEALSPVLLVVYRGRLLIADGYHRVSAAWHDDEDNEVACRIAWLTS